MFFKPLIVAAVLASFFSSEVNSANLRCDLKFLYRAENKFDVWKNDTSKVIYFKSDVDVNTDGSGRSYHPRDIAGNKGLSQNLICNAAKMRVGNKLATCTDDCQTCLDTFRSLPVEEMVERFGDYFASVAIAMNGKRACVAPSGSPNEGFFVSTTAYLRDDIADTCDQEKYLDSMVFPAIAVPDRLVRAGVQMGDIAVVRNRYNNRIEYAVVSDTSGKRLGEGSIALNRSLFCLGKQSGCVHPPMPTSVKESYGLVIHNADFIIFRGSKGVWPKKLTDISDRAKAMFNDWGGAAMLNDCAARYSPN